MSRYSQPIAPISGSSSLPVRPAAENSQQPQGTQSGDQAPKAFCKFDDYMMHLAPRYKPLKEKELHEFLMSLGATEATLGQRLQGYDAAAQRMIDGGGARVIGVKPLPGDPNVFTIRVPDSPYVLRMWDGGMDYYGHFCLDFYDIERKTPVNLPAGHGLYPGVVMPPGVPPPANIYIPRGARSQPRLQAFPSWEHNMGIHSFPEGEEKWSFPEGTCLLLRRDGCPDFPFQVPMRPRAAYGAQAQRGYPY